MKPIPRRSSTLKDVAQAAKVSLSTASRVLSGKAEAYRISEVTEKAVQLAAKQLRYRPSRIAQSLRSQTTGMIGVLLPDIGNPFFSAIANQVSVLAEKHSFSVLLACSRESTDTETYLVQELCSRQVDGLIVCPVGERADHLVELDATGLPMVLVDRGFSDSGMVTVMSENCEGATQLTRLVLEKGHRKVGILQGIPGTLLSEERLRGIRIALHEKRIEFSPALVRGNQFDEPSGYKAAHWLLKHHPDITAIIALNNLSLLGAMRAISELGIQVPEQLSLATFDDIPFADFLKTPLTAACQDVPGLGQTAAKLLLEHIKTGKQPEQVTHRLPVQLVVRTSIAPAPAL